ncbi:MAG: hypothetical protein EOM03_16385, partial [Clostridia bacterium]|nr:hypothetical protein [Clostridia bacterium]
MAHSNRNEPKRASGTVGRFVLRFLAWLAYDTYIRSESRLTRAEMAYRASEDQLEVAKFNAAKAKACHER